MMKTNSIAKLSTALVAALLVAGCGGGAAGSGPGFAPRPPDPPPPPPLRDPNSASKVIDAADTSQTFAAQGQNLYSESNVSIRYEAATDQYYVTIPGQAEALLYNQAGPFADGSAQYTTGYGGYTLTTLVSGAATDAARNYRYSNLATFTSGGGFGVTAFGMATPESAVPVTGTASYSGLLKGNSSEQVDYGGWGMYAGEISGSIDLAFDFAAGNLSGSLNPVLTLDERHDLGTLTFSQPVWGVGLSAFSSGLTGAILTGAPAGITGQFTGPAAQELIGSFFFGYVSPVSGQDSSAAGAFVARR